MPTGPEKVVQYLDEARATEQALVRTLQAHIAMTPKGDYRKVLERHLRETERHRDRVERRLADLGGSRGAVDAGVGVLQGLAGQVLALTKAPLDAVRGETGEERLLKNAKDESATEALEIATYRALEALARHVGDDKTAKLAADIRADEERMLEQLQELIPALTEAAADAEVVEPTYDAGSTGAADTARQAATRSRDAVDATRRRLAEVTRDAVDRVAATAREAVRQVTEAVDRGEDTVESTARTAVGGVRETAKEAERAVREAAKAARSEAGQTAEQAGRTAKQAGRRAERATEAAGDGGQPWRGYDDQTVGQINDRLGSADEQLARKVRDYERRHKKRKTILQRAESKAS